MTCSDQLRVSFKSDFRDTAIIFEFTSSVGLNVRKHTYPGLGIELEASAICSTRACKAFLIYCWIMCCIAQRGSKPNRIGASYCFICVSSHLPQLPRQFAPSTPTICPNKLCQSSLALRTKYRYASNIPIRSLRICAELAA